VTDELSRLESWAQDTIESFEAPERRRFLRSIGRTLRKNTQKRMAAQTGADGRKWAARKDGTRRKMFQRLRLGKNLKMNTGADHVKIGWSKKAGGLARIHHYGLRDRVSERGVRVKYEARSLLGLSKKDGTDIETAVEKWVSES